MQTMIANIRYPFTGYVVAYMLKRITIPLMKNVNGSYVIVQCVKLFPPKHQKVMIFSFWLYCLMLTMLTFGPMYIF